MINHWPADSNYRLFTGEMIEITLWQIGSIHWIANRKYQPADMA